MNMEKGHYITDDEREKCRSVVDAFAELYDRTDTIVVDARRYGFVKLQYYMLPHGFETIATYRDSKKLFEDLWQDWFEELLLTEEEKILLEDLDYEEIFALFPAERQKEILVIKRKFEEKSGISNHNRKL